MRQTAVLFGLLALLSGVARTEGPAVKPSFTWPLPGGWKAETIPFPLEFAPDVRHTGVEELRFSPGFGDPAAPDNWTYALAWVLEDKASFTAETLERELPAYFKGLSMAVGSKKFFFDTDHFSAHIRPRPAARASEARELFGHRRDLRLLPDRKADHLARGRSHRGVRGWAARRGAHRHLAGRGGRGEREGKPDLVGSAPAPR